MARIRAVKICQHSACCGTSAPLVLKESQCSHPGVITDGSDLWRHAGKVMRGSKTVQQGASTSVYCSVASGVVGGAFYSDCARAGAADWATNPALAARLWEETEKLVSQ